MASRLIDPRNVITRAADADHGVVSQAQVIARVGSAESKAAEPERNQLFIVQETLFYYVQNPPASGNTGMVPMVPSSTTALTFISFAYKIPGPARILGVRLYGTANVSAGTCHPLIAVIDSSGGIDSWDILECVIAAGSNQAATFVAWDAAIQVPKNGTISMNFAADASYANTTIDWVAQIVLGYEEWSL